MQISGRYVESTLVPLFTEFILRYCFFLIIFLQIIAEYSICTVYDDHMSIRKNT